MSTSSISYRSLMYLVVVIVLYLFAEDFSSIFDIGNRVL